MEHFRTHVDSCYQIPRGHTDPACVGQASPSCVAKQKTDRPTPSPSLSLRLSLSLSLSLTLSLSHSLTLSLSHSLWHTVIQKLTRISLGSRFDSADHTNYRSGRLLQSPDPNTKSQFPFPPPQSTLGAGGPRDSGRSRWRPLRALLGLGSRFSRARIESQELCTRESVSCRTAPCPTKLPPESEEVGLHHLDT